MSTPNPAQFASLLKKRQDAKKTETPTETSRKASSTSTKRRPSEKRGGHTKSEKQTSTPKPQKRQSSKSTTSSEQQRDAKRKPFILPERLTHRPLRDNPELKALAGRRKK